MLDVLRTLNREQLAYYPDYDRAAETCAARFGVGTGNVLLTNGLDEGILAAIDADTGELKWKGGRYGYGQVLLAGSNLIVLTEDGDLALVRAIPDRHQEITRFPVLEGKTWNVPALSGGYLLVRNLAEMAAFDLRVNK